MKLMQLVYFYYAILLTRLSRERELKVKEFLSRRNCVGLTWHACAQIGWAEHGIEDWMIDVQVEAMRRCPDNVQVMCDGFYLLLAAERFDKIVLFASKLEEYPQDKTINNVWELILYAFVRLQMFHEVVAFSKSVPKEYLSEKVKEYINYSNSHLHRREA